MELTVFWTHVSLPETRTQALRLARRLLGASHQRSEDIFHDAVVRGAQRFKTYHPEKGPLSVWFNAIVARLVMGHHRSDGQRLKMERSGDETMLTLFHGHPTNRLTPEENLDAERVGRLVPARLNVRQIRICQLFYAQGWPIEEIAVELSLPVSTVCTNLGRSRTKLRCAMNVQDLSRAA